MPDLMLKDKKVLSFYEDRGVVKDIGKLEDDQLLPICLQGNCTVETLNEWMTKRSIPDKREGIEDMIAEFGHSWRFSKNRLSLSDQYWVRMRMEEWRKINYFRNRYSTDVGDAFFSPWSFNKNKIDTNSPDLTTNGILKKRWRQGDDRKSYLIKAGSKATHQEPLSEILVSVLLEQLQIIPFVRYDYCVEGATLCSKCENFITENTELVPISHIYHKEPRPEGKSVYYHLLKMCDKYEIPGMQEYMDALIFIDNVSGNDDRNLGNIAVIRDVNTLKIIGPAPAFDFGAAYWSSGKITENAKSKKFGDVERNIFQKMRKRCDIEKILRSDNFARCINTYPRITQEKKENLVKAIKNRNKMLLKNRLRDRELG